ncbi:MAG: Uma2 family endonuclease [Chitinophagaceae bacterium]
MSYPIPKEVLKYTFAEYMTLEETSTERHDFYHGEIFAMAGGSKAHNNIILNLGVFLKSNKKEGCDVFIDGMKLEIEKNQFYVYPDLMLSCNENLKEKDLIVKYPSIIFEVLSDSTALYDAQVKLTWYKKIESLHYYVLVSQKELKVQVYSRIDNSQVWKYQTYETLDETILFDRLGFELTVATIYDGIAFDVSTT